MSTEPPHGDGSEGRSVDDLERLVAYLDGSLAAEERAEVEAALAQDAALRARLVALEHAERALADLEVTRLPEGARSRLDAALAVALDETLAGPEDPAASAQVEADRAEVAPTTAAAAGREVDELADRRTARRRPLAPIATGVAAGMVLLAGGVVGLSQLSDGGEDALTTMQAEGGEEAAPEPAPDAPSTEDALALELPVVIDEGRMVTDEDRPELLDDPELQALAQGGLSLEEGAALAAQVQARVLGADAATSTAPDDRFADGDPVEEHADEDRGEAPASGQAAPLVTRDGRTLDPETADGLRRCLVELLDAGEQAVPLAVEVVTLDGGDAAVFGLLTLDPDTGAFGRIEAWTLALDSCQVLRFAQS